MSLTDYSGKAVLLLFWVSHDASIGGQLLQMEEIHESFGRHEEFVMVGVWLDHDIEAARKFVRDSELKWINCFPTGEARIAVYDGYGGQTFPCTFLIGPDGKILAKNPSLGQLESALGKALETERW